jgi:hypothetical protein
MRLFGLNLNGLSYTHPQVIWGNDGRIHLQYNVSGYGSSSIVLIELCISRMNYVVSVLMPSVRQFPGHLIMHF